MDGGTSATSTTLVDADRIVVNDNGTMVQVALTDLTTYNESATNVTTHTPSVSVGDNTFSSISHDSGDLLNVFLNGVLLDSSDYTANSSADTVAITGLASTDVVHIQVISALSVSGIAIHTPTAVQGSNAYSVTNQSGDTINVYRNGVLLDSSDVTISAGNNTVTFTCVDTSDKIMIQVIQAVATSAPTAMGGTLTTDIDMGTTKKVKQKGAFMQSSTHQSLVLGG